MASSSLSDQVNALRVSVNSLTSRVGKVEMALTAIQKQIAALQTPSTPSPSAFSDDFSDAFGGR